MMILFKHPSSFFKLKILLNRYKNVKCFSLKENERVSFELSEQKMKKLYDSARQMIKDERFNKEDPFKHKINEIIEKAHQPEQGSESSKYNMILNSNNLDYLIEKKFDDKTISLSQIDKIYQQIETEEIDLFEQLGTKFYEDDYDFDSLNDEKVKTKVEFSSYSDDEEIQSIINSSLNNNNILNFDKIEEENKDEKIEIKQDVTSDKYSIIHSNLDDMDLIINKNVSKKSIKSKNNPKKIEKKQLKSIINNSEIEFSKTQEKLKQDHDDEQQLLNKIKNIDNEDKNQNHIDNNVNLESFDLINSKLNSDVITNTSNNTFTNPINDVNLNNDDQLPKEETPKKRASKKNSKKSNIPEIQNGTSASSINNYLKTLDLKDFEYYNNCSFFGTNIQDLSQLKDLLQNYIFDSEKKKKVLIENLGEFLLQNFVIKKTNLNYIISIFKNDFIYLNRENIDYLKKKTTNIRRLTFVFNEKSQKGLLKQDIGGLYIFGDENQIGSFFFNFGKVQNTKISLLFLIFQNLILHELILRESVLNIETSFVYTKKYDFDKSFSAKDTGRDYSQICLRNIIREMIKYKQSNNKNIKFYTHARLFNKQFIKDFNYINEEVSVGKVCFQHN